MRLCVSLVREMEECRGKRSGLMETDLGRESVYEREIERVRERERNNSYTLSIHNGGALKLSTVVDLVCVLSRMTVLQREQLKLV